MASDIPTLTADEAFVLRGAIMQVDRFADFCQVRDTLYCRRLIRGGAPTNESRAALAAYDEQQRREIQKPLLDLLDRVRWFDTGAEQVCVCCMHTEDEGCDPDCDIAVALKEEA